MIISFIFKHYYSWFLPVSYTAMLLFNNFDAISQEESQYNFIVIFCDNVGYGDIEPFGSEVQRTPNLTTMAQEGCRFTHFYSSSCVCTPSRSSLMTGCYAQRVGMHYNQRDIHVLHPISPYGLHPDEITIAEVLKKQNYATTIIGKWHLGDQPGFFPTKQGFDSFFGLPYSDNMTQMLGKRYKNKLDGYKWPPLPLIKNESVIEAPVDRNLLTQRETGKALEFIEENRDHPFFLYLAHNMPGSTSEPFSSPAFRGKSKNGSWGDAIEELDWAAGQILEKLKELDLDKQTLVIWTSDNGSPLAEEINPDSPNYDVSGGSNLPLHGRGYTTAEGGFRVPAIMWWPGKIQAGTVCSELCTTMDIMPTLAYLAGTKPPSDRIIDGHDIKALMFGEPYARSSYEVFYYYQQEQLQAVRSGQWKLFLPMENHKRHPHFKKGQKPKLLLFDVVNDISCSINLAKQHPQIVIRLMDLAEQARDDLGDQGIKGKNVRLAGYIENPQPMQ
jgi:arylsulfatase A